MKNEALEKFTQEKRSELIASIAYSAVEKLFASTKDASEKDSGGFKVVVSTADQDRQGEVVDQKGWDLTFYKANPIVLWGHDYQSLPIGMCTSIEVKDGKLVAEGKFAPADANPFAQQVRKLYDLGMINTTSVGFIPKEFSGEKEGVISKSELLEFSFVPVPANPYALRVNQIIELGIDVAMLKTKGLQVLEVKEVEVKEKEVVPVEEKGEVADKLEEIRQFKYIKYRPVCDTLDAFCSVYFSENTPTDDFGKLLGETADILKMIATSGGTETEEKTIKEQTEKLLAGSKSVGADIKSALELIMKHTHIALGHQAEGKKDSVGEVVETGSKSSEASKKEINAFVDSRELLRSIDRSVEAVLKRFNEAARSQQK